MSAPKDAAIDVRTSWGQQKRQRSLSLTDACWRLLTDQAIADGLSRSDLIERMVRSTYHNANTSTRCGP